MEETKGKHAEDTKMNEHKWTVDQCCCGCDLRFGSMIISMLSLVLNVINLTSAAYEATKAPYPTEANASWVSVIVAILLFIVSIMLVIGIQQEKRNFVMVWVWVRITMIVVSLIIATISFIVLAWTAAITIIVTNIIYAYCVVVVRSYAITIAEDAKSPA